MSIIRMSVVSGISWPALPGLTSLAISQARDDLLSIAKHRSTLNVLALNTGHFEVKRLPQLNIIALTTLGHEHTRQQKRDRGTEGVRHKGRNRKEKHTCKQILMSVLSFKWLTGLATMRRLLVCSCQATPTRPSLLLSVLPESCGICGVF